MNGGEPIRLIPEGSRTPSRRTRADAPETSRRPDKPLVEVLLATYNGELFLREQVESILNQSYTNLRIVARDDGSSDTTPAILSEFEQHFPERFSVVRDGVRSGSAKENFLRLLTHSAAPFVCLADQDDVWKKNKVRDSLAAMMRLIESRGEQTPLLVFSDLELVDRELQTTARSLWAYQGIEPRNIYRFQRLLTQNVVTGCTALLNRPLLELAITMPPESYMHDWWLALMAHLFGDAAYLEETTVLYRQHAANAVGAVQRRSSKRLPRWRYHARRREQWEQGERQAAALLRVHGSRLSPESEAILRDYVRCEESTHRMIRVGTMLRRGLFFKGLRQNLAILWYLWDMKAAKRAENASSVHEGLL